MDQWGAHRIVTPAGTIYFNVPLAAGTHGNPAGADGVRLQLEDITGAEFAANRGVADPKAGLPGSNWQGGLADSKYPNLVGEAQCPNHNARVAVDVWLRNWLDSMRETGGRWYFTEGNQPECYLDDVRVFGEGYTFKYQQGVHLANFTLGLIVPDPTIWTV